MTPERIDRIAARYPFAGAWDRFHLRHRLRVCPFDELLPFLPETGQLLDIGCGFGLLGWLLAEARPGLDYWGTDVDGRKIQLARSAFAQHPAGNKATHLHAGEALGWAETPARFTVITILDVLYLLPLPLQKQLFDDACTHLARTPEAALLLKILPAFRGADRWRTWLQESLMVKVLRKTRSSGAIFASQDPALYARWGEQQGLECRETAMPTTPPSTLLVLRPAQPATAEKPALGGH
jgi:2-polyprenyl-3-methyl-5-hydroxy-6-metoxy-1,4-benzoquinol methylase